MQKKFAGQTDTKLTALGIQQAEAIRPILADIRFDKVYSSDLSRAYDTQKTALPGHTAEQTPLLREVDVGALAGLSIPEVRANHPDIPIGDYTLFGGENRQMIDGRICGFMQMLEQQNYENVAVFAHRGVLTAFLRNIMGEGVGLNSVLCDNCAIFVLEYDGTKWSILALNYGIKL